MKPKVSHSKPSSYLLLRQLKRQSLTENLGTIGALIYLLSLQAQQQGDTQTQAQVAQTNLESFLNVPLSNICLTENGIVTQ